MKLSLLLHSGQLLIKTMRELAVVLFKRVYDLCITSTWEYQVYWVLLDYCVTLHNLAIDLGITLHWDIHVEREWKLLHQFVLTTSDKLAREFCWCNHHAVILIGIHHFLSIFRLSIGHGWFNLFVNHISLINISNGICRVSERTDLERRHLDHVLPLFKTWDVKVTNLILYVALETLLLSEGHDKQLILPLTGFDLLLHKPLLCDHSLNLCRHHIYCVKVVFFHLLEPVYLRLEPLHALL